MLGQVCIDLPRPSSVRIGQGIARDRGTTKSHVIQALGLRTKVNFDVAQRLPISKLRERHGQKLVQAREVLDFVFATMGRHTSPKRAQRQMRHDLRKNELALMHGEPLREYAKGLKSAARRSNRDQTDAPKSAGKSLTYDVLM